MKYFDENTQRVMVPPETHYDLDSSNKLLETLQNALPSIEEQFSPLNEQFKVLNKYEVSVPDDVSLKFVFIILLYENILWTNFVFKDKWYTQKFAIEMGSL